jgi:hypothetical protein
LAEQADKLAAKTEKADKALGEGAVGFLPASPSARDTSKCPLASSNRLNVESIGQYMLP